MRYALAAAPFVVAAVGLLALRWSAPRAGVVALLTAVIAAVLGSDMGVPGLLASAREGSGTAARVLYVLFGGLLLYRVLAAGGAIDAVSAYLRRIEPRPAALALVVVVGASPFFESVTGFGVAIVICAPILLGAGLSPLRAAALASWGQCAVPWGALAVGTVLGADLAGLSLEALSDRSALLNLPLYPLYGLATLALAGGRAAVRAHALEALGLGLAAGVGTLLTSVLIAPALSGAIGGLCAVAAFLGSRARRLGAAGAPGRALSPYGVLLALLAITSGPAAVQPALAALSRALTGPGPWLLVCAGFAAVVLGVRPATGRDALGATALQWLPVALATLTFVLTGQLVADSGGAALLAGGAAAGLGASYPLVAPLIGALGGALTGSNVGSNALFMPFQAEAAAATGKTTLGIAAVQNVAGSHASLLAPQRLVLAAAATGLEGNEGKIARTALAPVALSLALLAMVAAIAP